MDVIIQRILCELTEEERIVQEPASQLSRTLYMVNSDPWWSVIVPSPTQMLQQKSETVFVKWHEWPDADTDNLLNAGGHFEQTSNIPSICIYSIFLLLFWE